MSSGENHIPWAQIESLIRDGMTAGELGDAILARSGLSRATHAIRVTGWIWESVEEKLRANGVVILSIAQVEGRPYEDARTEVLRVSALTAK